MSVSTPMRKPRRIPCFTQAFTRHSPVAVRSAARTAPRLSVVRNSANSARSASPYEARSADASASSRSRSDMCGPAREPELLEELAEAGSSLLLDRDEREAEPLLEQAH